MLYFYNQKRKFIAGFILSFFLSGICHAQDIISGTGFVVNSQGYILTNKHVVEACSVINVQGDRIQNQNVALKHLDENYDLALLRMPERSNYTAKLRYNRYLKAGDKVLTVGYPEERGISRKHHFVASEIVNDVGPNGEEHWVQFESSIRQGNSGGPLLDRQGNVIGVVTAKLTRYTHAGIPIAQTDLAVSMPIIKKFLDQHFVHYDQIFTVIPREEQDLVNEASDYIVNIHCLP